MKSFIFSTDNDRGGVILCDLDTLEEAVTYLKKRFDGVIRVEQGNQFWQHGEGFGEIGSNKPSSPPSSA